MGAHHSAEAGNRNRNRAVANGESTGGFRGSGVPEITIEELARHKSGDSIWIAVRGEVFDITFFPHPGGRTLLL